jgi:hypothetical protein
VIGLLDLPLAAQERVVQMDGELWVMVLIPVFMGLEWLTHSFLWRPTW